MTGWRIAWYAVVVIFGALAAYGALVFVMLAGDAYTPPQQQQKHK